MNTTPITSRTATERNWCLFCPDLIVEGEHEITGHNLIDPFGDPGHAHLDCAKANGYEPDQIDTDEPAAPNPEADLRAAFRQHIRQHGQINLGPL